MYVERNGQRLLMHATLTLFTLSQETAATTSFPPFGPKILGGF